MLDKKNKAALFIVFAAFIWSTSFALTKVLLDSVPPLTIGAIRFVLAALFLWGVLKLSGNYEKPTKKTLLSMWSAGFLGIFIYFSLENFGVQFATASDATLIIASYPIIALALEVITRKSALNLYQLIGIILAIIGVSMVVQGGHQVSGGKREIGIVLLILGGFVWAAYNLLASQSASKGCKPLVMTMYQTQAGAIGFVIACLSEHESWHSVNSGDWFILLYLALACSVMAFYFYNAGLEHLPSSSAVNILNLVPIFGMFWAVVIAGESISLLQVFGGIVVVIGVFISIGVRRTRPNLKNSPPSSSNKLIIGK